MTKVGGYSNGVAQILGQIKEKLKIRFCLQSSKSVLATTSDMPETHCFSFGGMKSECVTILESFGMTEEIIFSLSRLP